MAVNRGRKHGFMGCCLADAPQSPAGPAGRSFLRRNGQRTSRPDTGLPTARLERAGVFFPSSSLQPFSPSVLPESCLFYRRYSRTHSVSGVGSKCLGGCHYAKLRKTAAQASRKQVGMRELPPTCMPPKGGLSSLASHPPKHRRTCIPAPGRGRLAAILIRGQT
jgi:hypothetical protein